MDKSTTTLTRAKDAVLAISRTRPIGAALAITLAAVSVLRNLVSACYKIIPTSGYIAVDDTLVAAEKTAKRIAELQAIVSAATTAISVLVVDSGAALVDKAQQLAEYTTLEVSDMILEQAEYIATIALITECVSAFTAFLTSPDATFDAVGGFKAAINTTLDNSNLFPGGGRFPSPEPTTGYPHVSIPYEQPTYEFSPGYIPPKYDPTYSPSSDSYQGGETPSYIPPEYLGYYPGNEPYTPTYDTGGDPTSIPTYSPSSDSDSYQGGATPSYIPPEYLGYYPGKPYTPTYDTGGDPTSIPGYKP